MKKNIQTLAVVIGLIIVNSNILHASCCDSSACCWIDRDCYHCDPTVYKGDENIKNELLRRKAAGENYNEKVLQYLLDNK